VNVNQKVARAGQPSRSLSLRETSPIASQAVTLGLSVDISCPFLRTRLARLQDQLLLTASGMFSIL
jgi:hypothetical protein